MVMFGLIKRDNLFPKLQAIYYVAYEDNTIHSHYFNRGPQSIWLHILIYTYIYTNTHLPIPFILLQLLSKHNKHEFVARSD